MPALDTTKFSSLLREYVRRFNVSEAFVLKAQMRIVMEKLVKVTPPKTKEAGEKKITHDFGRMFSGAKPEFIDEVLSAHGRTTDPAYVNRQGKPSLKLLWPNVDWQGGQVESHHRKARGSPRYGRRFKAASGGASSNVWDARFKLVAPNDSIAKYRELVLKRVGYTKAGWKAGCLKYGASMPKWVNRHDGSNGTAKDGTAGFFKRRFVMATNYTDGVRDIQGLVSIIIRGRVRAMKSDLSHYAKLRAKEVGLYKR